VVVFARRRLRLRGQHVFHWATLQRYQEGPVFEHSVSGLERRITKRRYDSTWARNCAGQRLLGQRAPMPHSTPRAMPPRLAHKPSAIAAALPQDIKQVHPVRDRDLILIKRLAA
jgi:hypothetical protein